MTESVERFLQRYGMMDPAFDFDGEAFVKNVRLVNPSAPVLFLSSKTGEGIAEMAAAVRERIRKKG